MSIKPARVFAVLGAMAIYLGFIALACAAQIASLDLYFQGHIIAACAVYCVTVVVAYVLGSRDERRSNADAQLATFAKSLADPEFVHVCMMRGTIANPGIERMLHMLGGDLLKRYRELLAAQKQAVDQ